ncbi:MAG: flagellar hook-associated protein FlgK [Asticcacaulis sp.]
MSLNSILNIGTSGLMTAQNQLKIVSDNISNVNTPGYIRKIGTQEASVLGGQGAGVSSAQVRLAADKYLQQASLRATSASSQASVFHELFDQIQSQFGDLTDSTSLFNLGDSALSTLASAAENTTSSAARQEVISSLDTFFAEGSRIAGEIQSARASADGRISTAVSTINDLIKNISDLNPTISQASISGSDATGAQIRQASYIDELSKLIDVDVTTNSNGGVTVRTTSGMVLAGDQQAKLSYQPTSPVTASTTFNSIIVTGSNGEQRDFTSHIKTGELRALLDLRDTESTAVSAQLSEYMSVYAEQLNAAHNASSAVPAPQSLTGKAMSQTFGEALSGFADSAGTGSGTTSLVVLNSDNTVASEVALTFSRNAAGSTQVSINGGPAVDASDSSLLSQINSALSPQASLSYTNNTLSFTAASGYGVAVGDDPTAPALKNGKGFSHFFGLNDLVRSDVPLDYATGLTATSAHGFDSGSVSFQISNSGSGIQTMNVSFPTNGTMADMVNALNDSSTGLGRYGTFSLSSTGQLSFKGFGNPANALSITADTTSRLDTGASFSAMFGLGNAPLERVRSLSLDTNISNNLDQLSLATLNLDATGTTPALVSGDGTGAQRMAAIGSASITFQKAGYNAGGTSSLTRYAADLAGQVGTLASTAKSRMDGASALAEEASSRRSAAEGVNLDEELINLTTYQQAYSASSRLIQAAKDMYDVLLNMI